jgi:dUTP pyrophosphatase
MPSKIKVKKLHSGAVIPRYAREGDAGMDVHAVSKVNHGKFIEYDTGLAFEIPEGYVCLVFPRSSVSNKSLSQCNSVGVLDSGYRGELKIRFYKHGEEEYEVGEKIGQIMIIPFPKVEFEEAEELNQTDWGEGGFGSTGK